MLWFVGFAKFISKAEQAHKHQIQNNSEVNVVISVQALITALDN